MAPVSDSFAARVVVVLLVALIIAQGLVAAAMLSWPGRQLMSYSLPLPQQMVAIIEAYEAADAAQRPRIIDAVNSPMMSVTALATFPARTQSGPVSPLVEQLLKGYSAALLDRDFRVDTQRVSGLFPSLRLDESGAIQSLGPVHLLVRVQDGSALLFSTSASAALAINSARIAAVAAVLGAIIVVGFLIAIRQTTRPVRELAASAQRFAHELDTADLTVRGPREIRALAMAFNEMKKTIRELVGERTRILAAIAHDMRTYLTRLRLRVDFIDDARQRQRAGRDLDEMAALLEDTLLFARESAQGGPTPQIANPIAVVRAARDARRQTGVNVEIDLPAEAPNICMSALALTRIVDNLLDNALRYGVRAHVSMKQADTHVHLIVEDEGPGIPEEAMARCLQPFQRLDDSRGRATGGAGLGLAIVQALTAQARGSVQLENRSAGGLRVIVSLPTFMQVVSSERVGRP